MGYQCTTMRESQVLVNGGFLFPHKSNGECTNIGTLGWLHGMGNVHVGVRWGDQRWAVNCCMMMIPGAFVAPSTPPSMPKMAWPSSSLCAISVPILVVASSSMSPALLCFPHTISLLSCSPPQAFARPCIAKKASPVTAVIAVLLAIVIIGGHPTVADGHRYGILQCIRGLEGLWTLYTGAIGTDIAAGGDGLVGRGFRLHFGRLH